MDFSAVDRRISALEACIENTVMVAPGEPLHVGVDLGTAYIVVVALDEKKEPVACAMESAQVVRDGLVLDYAGAVRIVSKLVAGIEARLGQKLSRAAIAVPPGTGKEDCATHRHVLEAAGLEVVGVLDEPTAANAVLGIENGVIVDIGGGTIGLSILENGKVVYVADEPTGGRHLSLVLAGSYRISFEEAEALKKQPARHREVLPVVSPVLEKMASIINAHINKYTGANAGNRQVAALYLVGGTCCLEGMERVIERETGIPAFKPANPFLVTPLGIALSG